MDGMHLVGEIEKFRCNGSREGGRYGPQKSSKRWRSDRDEEMKEPEKVSTKRSTHKAVAREGII